MDDDMFNTGWDPHTALIMCEQNIQQCAHAINNGTEIMKDLAFKLNHQQEVIQQLVLQNNRLQKSVEGLKHRMIIQDTQIQLLTAKHTQQSQ